MRLLLHPFFESVPLAFLLLALFTGCAGDTFIDPFDNEARYYTVYGYLDEVNRDHAFRVIPLTRTIPTIEAREEGEALDAVLRVINLSTGAVATGRYALERLSDDTFAHVFHVNQVVWQGDAFRVEVERSDGTQVWAETTVPEVHPTNDAPRFSPVVEADGEIVQDIILPRMTSPWGIELWYFVACDQRAVPIRIPYGRSGERVEEGWRFTAHLSRDTPAVRMQAEALGCPGPERLEGPVPPPLIKMGIRIKKLDATWEPPNDRFSPDLFAHPTAFSNIENGYGFFGSAALYAFDWEIPDDLPGRLGYPN